MLHISGVGTPVNLCAQAVNGRALSNIEHPALQGVRIRRAAHLAAERIELAHEMAFARDVSSHVVYMADGVICEEGTPADIFEHPQNAKTVEFLSRFRQA